LLFNAASRTPLALPEIIRINISLGIGKRRL